MKSKKNKPTKNNQSNSKHAQITIFIIVAILIIVVLIILFLVFQSPTIRNLDENNPQSFVESCTRESVELAIERLSKQGGDINPRGYIDYQDEKVKYLCYNANFYEQCINQRPLLIEHIENEITNFIRPQIEECFFTLKK